MHEYKRIKRFWKLVDKQTDGCWLWRGSTDVNGYGFYGEHKYRAHRIAYEEVVGTIPIGYVLHHKCHNPRCVNPSHMELTTQSLHEDAAPNLNRQKTHCSRGHEFSPENTRIVIRTRRGRLTRTRMCRTCDYLSHYPNRVPPLLRRTVQKTNS